MQIVRQSDARGHANFGWLDARHSFSFGHYFDPDFMGFGSLRVINEDRISPGAGFDTHGHKNMEIITWVLEGALEHKDSLGHGEVLRPGEIQRMTAGSGIRHSEFNHSKTDPVHLLQIWIEPERDGLEPSYEQKTAPTGKSGELVLIGARDARNGAVKIHQDVDLYLGKFSPGDQTAFEIRPGRKAWLQVVRGGLLVNGAQYGQGDALGISDLGEITLSANGDSSDDVVAEILLFDLAA